MAIITLTLHSGVAKMVSVAGTVVDAVDAPVARRVIGYRNEDEAVVAFSVMSDGSGVIATTTNGNHNDRFRVIALGIAGENSQIEERVPGE